MRVQMEIRQEREVVLVPNRNMVERIVLVSTLRQNIVQVKYTSFENTTITLVMAMFSLFRSLVYFIYMSILVLSYQESIVCLKDVFYTSTICFM